MKRDQNINIVFVWFLLSVFFAPFPCSGQDAAPNAPLVDLYVQSVFYPEKFNDYVNDNRHQYDDAFQACLDKLTEKYLLVARTALASCASAKAEDEQLYANCYKDNSYAQMYMWLFGVDQVLRGNKRWEDTNMGNSMLTAKMYANTIMPGFWEETQKLAVEYVKPLLSCK